MNPQELNAEYTILRLVERLRDADNFNYQDACRAADVIEHFKDQHTKLTLALGNLLIAFDDARSALAKVSA